MSNPEASRRLLAELKSLGVEVCLDDFGTGYSSLSYLHQFPLDLLKVDRSFVGAMSGVSGDPSMVQTIVNLALQLGMAVVAEGVETPEQLAALQRMGCHFAQGYYFARPFPYSALAEHLNKQRNWLQREADAT